MKSLSFSPLHFGLLCGALVLVPSIGEAQDDQHGRGVFRVAQAQYEAGQFLEAGRGFEEAYRLSARPQLLFNAYVAYRDGMDLENAARALRLYLESDAVDSLEVSERDQLRARLTSMERSLAESAAARASSPPIGSETAQQPEVESNATDAPIAEVMIENHAEVSTADEGFKPSPVGWIVLGIGGAMFVSGIVTGVLAADDYSTLRDRCPNGVCADSDELRDMRSRGETLSLATDIMLWGGLAVAATGTVLLFVLQDSKDREQPAFTAMCEPTGCYGDVTWRY